MASSYLHLIQDGLPKTNHPQKIIIVGAGMAGLAAGYELLRAGHQVQFLEARQRVGWAANPKRLAACSMAWMSGCSRGW